MQQHIATPALDCCTSAPPSFPNPATNHSSLRCHYPKPQNAANPSPHHPAAHIIDLTDTVLRTQIRVAYALHKPPRRRTARHAPKRQSLHVAQPPQCWA